MYALLVYIKFQVPCIGALWASVFTKVRLCHFERIGQIDVRSFYSLEVPILGHVKKKHGTIDIC